MTLRSAQDGSLLMTKSNVYDSLVEQLASLLSGERDRIANAANTAALVWGALDEVNWAGFYFAQGNELVVGPFQGKPACTRIALGRGVCGAAAQRRETLVVPDVREFPGHIACDAASRSEIVVPIISGDNLVGVLDLDSPVTNRFDENDRKGLERVVETFVANTNLM
jgi:L-methionine (R)-S-oxide reductase